jgi:hypothetical protein
MTPIAADNEGDIEDLAAKIHRPRVALVVVRVSREKSIWIDTFLSANAIYLRNNSVPDRARMRG